MADGRLELRDLVVVDLQDRTPLKLACSHQPDVAAWLIIHGAASAGLNTALVSTTRAGSTASSSSSTTNTTPSSCSLTTGANNETIAAAAAAAGSSDDSSSCFDRYGHCDAKVLLEYAANSGVRRAISEILEEWLHQHATFTRLILPAVRCRRIHQHGDTSDFSVVSTTAGRRPPRKFTSKHPNIGQYALLTTPLGAPSSAISILGGHEETLLALIADFVDVIRGRQLRNARVAAAFLAPP